MNKKSFAFTLSEVLITLGIIGVVAALTIPSLMHNVQENEWHQAWKKEFSALAQAYERVKQDEGGDLSDCFGANVGVSAAPLIQKMGDYLNLLENCGLYYNSVCGSKGSVILANGVDTPYKTLSGLDNVNPNNLFSVQYLLKDGANFYSRAWAYEDKQVVWIDVNGFLKGPNVLGKDFYGALLTKDKIMPMGAQGSGVEDTCVNTSVSCNGGVSQIHHMTDCSGAGCSAEYLYK